VLVFESNTASQSLGFMTMPVAGTIAVVAIAAICVAMASAIVAVPCATVVANPTRFRMPRKFGGVPEPLSN